MFFGIFNREQLSAELVEGRMHNMQPATVYLPALYVHPFRGSPKHALVSCAKKCLREMDARGGNRLVHFSSILLCPHTGLVIFPVSHTYNKNSNTKLFLVTLPPLLFVELKMYYFFLQSYSTERISSHTCVFHTLFWHTCSPLFFV